ncbi:MAG: DUF2294 domain-containing protein [Alicyclobacillaceae bacterium]|nr:DUF2294 domain-containing protein [Alicyclobacillaceae bacterium]
MAEIANYCQPEGRKTLARLYNEVNKEIYGFGVNQLKVEIDGNIITFLVKHQRVTALKALEERYPVLKQVIDFALYHEFKLRFKKKLEQEANLKVESILRDYDPASLWGCTLVILE